MKKLLALLVVVLVVAAYVGGYWPQRERRVAVETEMADVRARLHLAESRVRLAALLGELIALADAVSERNYGQAQQQSSRFFDAVRDELSRTTHADQRDALEWVLRSRDGVTVALARSDAGAASDLLRRIQVRLRLLLGYPAAPPSALPELPAGSPAPSAPPSTPAASTSAGPAASPTARATPPAATPAPGAVPAPPHTSPSPGPRR